MATFQRFQMHKRLSGRTSSDPSPFDSKTTIPSCWVDGVEGRKRKEGKEAWTDVEEGFKSEAGVSWGLGQSRFHEVGAEEGRLAAEGTE